MGAWKGQRNPSAYLESNLTMGRVLLPRSSSPLLLRTQTQHVIPNVPRTGFDWQGLGLAISLRELRMFVKGNKGRRVLRNRRGSEFPHGSPLLLVQT